MPACPTYYSAPGCPLRLARLATGCLLATVLSQHPAAAWGEDYSGVLGLTTSAGYAYDRGRGNGVGLDVHGHAILVNASAQVYRFEHERESERWIPAVYIGVGYLHLIEAQLGVDRDGLCERLRTNIALDAWSTRGQWCTYRNEGSPMIVPVVSAYIEHSDSGGRAGILLGISW